MFWAMENISLQKYFNHIGFTIYTYIVHVSFCRKTFMFASKQHPPVHFGICGKTFVVQGKTVKVLSLEGFILYGLSYS